MKRKFRIIVGMLLLAIPLCMNAQVTPAKSNQDPEKAKVEQEEKKKAEMERREQEKKQGKGGFEMPKLSGFVQGMYQANLNNEGELVDNTFRLRRVRLSVDGTLFKGLTYKIQGDFSRSPMLVDAYLKYKVCNGFAIQVGQFKLPFSIESPINPVNLEIFDYGESVQKLVGYGDVCGVGALGRDIGVMISGNLFPVKGEEGIKYHVVDYALGLFNGNGATIIDNNNRKDIVGRLEVHPGLKALTLSGSYYHGLYRNATVEDQIESNGLAAGKVAFPNGIRNRWGAGIQYNDGKLVLRGEYFSGKTGCKIGGLAEQGNPIVLDHIQYSNGYYAVAGYNFGLGKEKSQKFMPVLRYEHFTADKAVVGGTNWYTAGINYWPLKSVNCKLDYSFIQQKANGTNSHRIVAMVSYKF